MSLSNKVTRLHRAINWHYKRYGYKYYPSYWGVDVDTDSGTIYLVYYSPLYSSADHQVDPWTERGGNMILRRAKLECSDSYVRDFYRSDGETTYSMEVGVIK